MPFILVAYGLWEQRDWLDWSGWCSYGDGNIEVVHCTHLLVVEVRLERWSGPLFPPVSGDCKIRVVDVPSLPPIRGGGQIGVVHRSHLLVVAITLE